MRPGVSFGAILCFSFIRTQQPVLDVLSRVESKPKEIQPRTSWPSISQIVTSPKCPIGLNYPAGEKRGAPSGGNWERITMALADQ
ncbi:unnamed protein product [Amoebophrya sp. A25]|nr:unnamed protein product [Amoebophrya sp. A25]|eukprot:GSA25T00014736001.1